MLKDKRIETNICISQKYGDWLYENRNSLRYTMEYSSNYCKSKGIHGAK